MSLEEQQISIRKAIVEYSRAYASLQQLQQSSELIPEGDQKTGCIGEFYAYLFLRSSYPTATLVWGSHSSKGWDIKVKSPRKSEKMIQVKTVSAYAKKRTMSPVHHGWDCLLLFYLDTSFVPQGFWQIKDNTIVKPGQVRRGLRCPLPDGSLQGSRVFKAGQNRITEWRKAVGW